MKNSLVLLTKTYPFDKGEEFIEDEVPVLAKAFSHIYLIATSTASAPVQTRKTPDNVTVLHICAAAVKRRLLSAALPYFPFTDFRGYADKNEQKAIHGALKKRAYLAYFTAKAEAVYREAKTLLNGCDLDACDGVTFYSYWFYDIALAAIRLRDECPNKCKKAVSRAHRYDLYADRNALNYLPLRPYLLQQIDKVYPCSEDGRRYLQNLYPEYRSKIETAYLGTRDFGAAPAPAGQPLRIASCCHISPVKRVEMLAQSLALLKNSGLPLQWTHFGGGDGLDALKTYASEHLFFMDVTFAGSVKNTELMAYYQTQPVDLFINTSSSEGLPVSIMEACSFGIPSIATNVGGTSEIIRQDETGYLLDCDFSPKELADRILSFSRTPKAEQDVMRQNCRRIWQENFCGETNFTHFAAKIQPHV
ncbi:glycosyltransferase [Clostridium sp. D33t1_170424_F3]|uniref:glycosyltransferase n=1 Tax=Clostridium sp. D33t1_170424_F3 TaxID=2787099 RepID=UPI0018ABDF8D|nr:glycosyltransferase [Clostridium sp. D33t1_170424_F3]